MGSKRKQYTLEFKDSAVKLVTGQGYKLSELREVSVSRQCFASLENCSRGWRKAKRNGKAVRRSPG